MRHEYEYDPCDCGNVVNQLNCVNTSATCARVLGVEVRRSSASVVLSRVCRNTRAFVIGLVVWSRIVSPPEYASTHRRYESV